MDSFLILVMIFLFIRQNKHDSNYSCQKLGNHKREPDAANHRKMVLYTINSPKSRAYIKYYII